MCIRDSSTAQPACFLIADISGYTGYLADVELDHAQDILADLIGAVVSALRPNFRLAKLEGDAAFTSMSVENVDGSMLLDTIERCYFGFRRRRRDVRQATCGGTLVGTETSTKASSGATRTRPRASSSCQRRSRSCAQAGTSPMRS